MKYAVIQTGGKQYKVSEGDIIEVERLAADSGQKLNLTDILLYTDNGTATIGAPLVQGISVAALVLEHTKGDKIRVAKFKAKARYRRVTGHRQSLTKLKIESIGSSSGKVAKSSENKEEELGETIKKPVKAVETTTEKKKVTTKKAKEA
jgi:large subunit ribosomal protein L21